MVLGYPRTALGGVYNAASLLRDGQVVATYHKHHLPNYSVFDEKRYFVAADDSCVVEIKGVPVGITICEDAWSPGPLEWSAEAGARLIVNINASPYHIDKGRERERVMLERIRTCQVPVIYVNVVGGQDELVFDGDSFVMDAAGKVVQRGLPFAEDLYPVDFTVGEQSVTPVSHPLPVPLSREASAYGALVMGVRDYVSKNGFNGAIIGLSGAL